MFLLNWGAKGKRVCDGGVHFCTNCNHSNSMEIRSVEKNIGVFFIPVAKWDKKFYLVCSRCTAGFPLLENKVDEFIRSMTDGPNSQLAITIYKKIDNIFAEGDYLKVNGRLDFFSDEVVAMLEKEGYKKSYIDKVLPAYLQWLAHELNKIK